MASKFEFSQVINFENYLEVNFFKQTRWELETSLRPLFTPTSVPCDLTIP